MRKGPDFSGLQPNLPKQVRIPGRPKNLCDFGSRLSGLPVRKLPERREQCVFCRSLASESLHRWRRKNGRAKKACPAKRP
jgi:hypothetical protein